VSTAQGAPPLRFAVHRWQRFRELRGLEDAVNYRLARLTVSCVRRKPAAAGDRRDEHACDVALIAGYLHAAEDTMTALAELTHYMRKDGGRICRSPATTRRGG
jgi:hypothetical protein